jgi:hypothetical protein
MMDVDYEHMQYLDRITDFNTVSDKENGDKIVLDTMKDISKQVRDTIKIEKAEKSNTSDDIMDILGLS